MTKTGLEFLFLQYSMDSDLRVASSNDKLMSYHVATYNCKMKNDKRDSKTQEEKSTVAAIRSPGRSLATGSAGFLFWQSNRLFVL